MVLLTTNFEVNMDPAFARRILFKIEFPRPGVQEREKIWHTLIPEEAPCEDDLDVERLAERFDLTGGQIKNAVVRAAYRCLRTNDPLHLEVLANAAHDEARAAGVLSRALTL